MKTRILSAITILVLGLSTVMGQNEKKESFEVAGNCGMCKTRIEKAAKSVDGVSAANWDKETKMIEVTFDPKVDIHQVHMAIANAGHDTRLHKASDEVYDDLPGCCHYERMSTESAHGSTMHQH